MICKYNHVLITMLYFYNHFKRRKNMSLAMPNIKTLLTSLRENGWYITAFPFNFYNHCNY